MKAWLSSYLSQDAAKISLPPDARAALKAHWAGDLASAQTLYEAVDFNALTPEIRGVLQADRVLIGVKRGQPFPAAVAPEVFETRAARVVYYYARFSWAFWVDHKLAWSALRRMTFIAPFAGMGALTWTGLFLTGHMLAIAGRRRLGLLFTRLGWALADRVTLPKMATNIIFSTFPYTLVVSGKLGSEFERAVQVGERKLGVDPYYISLFEVSTLYGYAYTGEIARAEVYARRLYQTQQQGRLLRYVPVSKIMTVLPLAIRGFGHLIRDDFARFLREHDPAKSDPFINSQFYRASAVIALFSGDGAQAELFILKAMEFRRATRSFHTWARFDKRVLELATRERPFDPQRDAIHFLQPQFNTPANLGAFVVKLYLLLGGAELKAAAWVIEQISLELKDQVGWTEAELLDRIPDAVTVDPGIVLGTKYLSFQGLPEARRAYVREMLSSLHPVVKATLRIHQERLEAREREKEAVIGQIASQVAHDIRAPIAALKAVAWDDGNDPAASRALLQAAVGRIEKITDDLLEKRRAPAHPVSLGSIMEPMVAEARLRLAKRPGVHLDLAGIEDAASTPVPGAQASNLTRSLANLFDNSLAAVGASGRIQIAAGTRDGNLVLQVKDDGIGMPEDLIPLLGPRGVTRGKAGGTGLGLSFVYRTVEECGGCVRVESSRGAGTTVEISLPSA